MHLLRKYDVAPFGRNDAMFAQCAVRHTSLGVAVIICEANIICRRQTSLKKALAYASAFFWWERVDSDHRSHRQQIYSLPPLATRERSHIMELVIGVEPTTC